MSITVPFSIKFWFVRISSSRAVIYFISITPLDNGDSFGYNKPFEGKVTFSEGNVLFIDNFPIPLNKLIELVNIQLLKIKFNSQAKIKIKDYDLDLNSKFFSKEGISIKLTEKEIEIILYLNSNKIKHNVLDLQKNIWKYSSDLETHTVETHIYRLRKKIDDKFSDKNFILSHPDGYFIE